MDWRDAPSLSALRAFEAAVRHGSLSKAAAELNVTHAAIAQHVRKVEDFVSLPLLMRDGRGMTPTPAGQQLAIPLREAFSQIIQAVQDTRRLHDDGPLKVSVTPSFAEHWLMPRLVAFWNDHPDIAVSVNPSTELIDLRRDGFDLAIRYGRGDWPGTDAHFIVAADYVVAASPKLLAGDVPDGLAGLTDYVWLLETQFGETRRWAKSNGIEFDGLTTRNLSTPNLVLAATRAGAGVSIQSRTLIAPDLETGQLVTVLEVAPQDRLGYYVVTRPGEVSSRVRTFSKWLRAAV